jgi:hypothetical protein
MQTKRDADVNSIPLLTDERHDVSVTHMAEQIILRSFRYRIFPSKAETSCLQKIFLHFAATSGARVCKGAQAPSNYMTGYDRSHSFQIQSKSDYHTSPESGQERARLAHKKREARRAASSSALPGPHERVKVPQYYPTSGLHSECRQPLLCLQRKENDLCL